jgi:hypothetical protein
MRRRAVRIESRLYDARVLTALVNWVHRRRTGVLVAALFVIAFGEYLGYAMWFGMAMTGDGPNELGAASTSTPSFLILNGLRIAMALALAVALALFPFQAMARWSARALVAAIGLTACLLGMFFGELVLSAVSI